MNSSASRASRSASSARDGRARLVPARLAIQVATWRVEPGEAVAVEALERRDALTDGLASSEPLASRLALLDAAPEPPHVAGLVAGVLPGLVERRELVDVVLLHRGDRRVYRVEHLRRGAPCGRPRTVERRGRVDERVAQSAGVAGQPRARPSWPPDRRAARRASSASVPSPTSAAWIVSPATATSSTRWQRDRTVSGSSSAASLTRTITVRSGGSSSVFKSRVRRLRLETLRLEEDHDFAGPLDRGAPHPPG